MSSYDPNVIIEAAEEKLTNSDFEGGQMMFQSALLDWVDDAREGSRGDPESMREAVASLWLAYAHFLAKAKQFKSATEAFEQALECPVASHVGRVWLDYARFAEDRGKLKTAQNVYMRALVGNTTITDQQDQSVLWQEFLEMMQKSNPELTLEELKTAVQTKLPPPPLTSSSPVPPPPMKRPKLEDFNSSQVTAEAVEVEAVAFGEGCLAQHSVPPDLAAAWMIRDGNGPAQPPEPPLFQPSPPKLSDPVR
jgi:tetratricopeptide (TPR) repeat protein